MSEKKDTTELLESRSAGSHLDDDFRRSSGHPAVTPRRANERRRSWCSECDRSGVAVARPPSLSWSPNPGSPCRLIDRIRLLRDPAPPGRACGALVWPWTAGFCVASQVARLRLLRPARLALLIGLALQGGALRILRGRAYGSLGAELPGPWRLGRLGFGHGRGHKKSKSEGSGERERHATHRIRPETVRRRRAPGTVAQTPSQGTPTRSKAPCCATVKRP